jgi:hypothetical protein
MRAPIGANIVEADSSIQRLNSLQGFEAGRLAIGIKPLFHSTFLDEKSYESMITDCDELCKLLYSILKSRGRISKD